MGVGGVLDPAQHRRLRRVPGIQVEHLVARADSPGPLDELLGRGPQPADGGCVDHVRHGEIAVSPVGGDLRVGQVPLEHARYLRHGPLLARFPIPSRGDGTLYPGYETATSAVNTTGAGRRRVAG